MFDVSQIPMDVQRAIDAQNTVKANALQQRMAEQAWQQEQARQNRLLQLANAPMVQPQQPTVPSAINPLVPSGPQQPKIPMMRQSLPPAAGFGEFTADQQWEQQEEARAAAQEKRWMDQEKVYNTWSKNLFDTTKHLWEESTEAAKPVFNSIITAYRNSGNPYLTQQAEAMEKAGVESMVKIPKPEKPGKDRDISIPATVEDIDRILKDPNVSQAVKDNLGSWKGRLAKMKPADRPINFQLKYDADGELVGVKDTYAPPQMKVNVSTGSGSGEGKTGKFTDDEYERFYNMGQKSEGLPQRVRGTARANQQARADWDAGYRDWLKRGGKSGATAGLEATEQRGDMKAMEKIKLQKGAIFGFEKGAINAMNIADSLNKEVARGKFPGINKLSLALKYHAGDDTVKAFRNAVVTAMTEYMKVVTAGTNISSTELSVGAQERAKQLLDVADNPATFKKQLNVFMREMEGKKKGILDQEAEIRKGMNRAGSGKIPTLKEWMIEAKKANPGVSEKVLGKYYDEKYKNKGVK